MTDPTPELLANNFAELCGRLLALALEHLTDADAAPPRSFLSAGVPAWDLDQCGQLALYPSLTMPGLPGVGQGGRPETSPHTLHTYALMLELARCVPTVQTDGESPIFPTTDELNAAGARLLRDYRLLDTFLARKVGINSKIRDPLCGTYGLREVAPGGVTTINPQGGMAAVRVAFSVVC